MQEEYRLAELAALLKRSERSIKKDMEGALLEGRKIQGEWVFSLNAIVAYIGHNIIDGLEDTELIELLRTAERRIHSEQALSVASLLSPESIAIPFTAKTQGAVIRDIIELAVKSGKLWDGPKMTAAVTKREELCSTAMDNGVALLHPRRPMPGSIAETFLTLGIAPRGVPFGGGFNNLTDIFFLVCSSDDQVHLRVLARIGRLLKQKGVLDTIRTIDNATELIDYIRSVETKGK